MANPPVILTIGMITRRAMAVLENNLAFTKYVNRNYDDQYAVAGAKIGTTLNVRLPPRFIVQSGAALQLQDYVETMVPVVIDQQDHVDITFSSADLTLSLDDFSDRVIQPAVAALANIIDYKGMQLYRQVYNMVGTPGTPPASSSGNPVAASAAMFLYGKGMQLLDDEAAPRDNQRSSVINPEASNYLVSSLSGLFHSTTEIEAQYRSGNMGLMGGAKYSMDQNVNVHTFGPLGGSPTVRVQPAEGATVLETQAWSPTAAPRLRAGDVFTIAGVYAVNPQSRQRTNWLRTFTVRSDAPTIDTSGNISIPIDPPIYSSGARQTVSTIPTVGLVLGFPFTASTVSPQNLMFHKDAFVCASADLVMPGGVDMADRVQSRKLGFSMRLVRQYDINTDLFPCRIDILYGWKCVRPQLAVRIAG